MGATHQPTALPALHQEFSTYKISYKLLCHSEFSLSLIKLEDIRFFNLLLMGFKNSKKYIYFSLFAVDVCICFPPSSRKFKISRSTVFEIGIPNNI